MSVNFSQLPIPNMVESLDYETLFNERKEAFIATWKTQEEQAHYREILSRESEPLTKYLQENAYRELILRNRINTAACANLLAFAKGQDLDAVAANFDVSRLLISEATSNNSAVYESDDDLRSRVQMKFDSLSTAGPENSYKYHAFSADGRVVDVAVTSPSPACVNITLLQEDTVNNSTTDEVIQKVKDALNAEDVRPIGDRVDVKNATFVPYKIIGTIFTNGNPEDALLLQTAISNIQAYAYQKKRLGRSIYLSEIYAKLHLTGIKHVVLDEPKADILLKTEEASLCDTLEIKLGMA